MDFDFVWHAWHLQHWVGTGDALVLLMRWVAAGHRLCVAGVALGDVDLHFNSTRTQLTHTHNSLTHNSLTHNSFTHNS